MKPKPPSPWVLVGKLGRPVGLGGLIRVRPEAEIEEIIKGQVPLSLWRPPDPPQKSLRIRSVRQDAKGWVFGWEGFDSREDLSSLANSWVVARREDLPEPKDGFVYSFDLIGARVETKEGRDVGTVTDLFETAAHHVIQIETEAGKEFLVPLTQEVDADLGFATEPGESNRLLIHLPEGMEEATETPEKREKPSRKLEDKRKETC